MSITRHDLHVHVYATRHFLLTADNAGRTTLRRSRRGGLPQRWTLVGLYELLGFRFAPRLRDLPDQTLYRARPGADYGPLNRVLRRRLRADLIVGQWGGARPPGRLPA